MKIHSFAIQGNIEGIAQELTNGVAIDTIDERSGYTPLMCAVTSAEADRGVVRFLIEKGADVNARRVEQFTETIPVDLADFMDDLSEGDGLEFLTTMQGETHRIEETVLGLAVSTGDLGKISLLLEAGADINYKRENGYSVLIDLMYGRDIARDENLTAVVEFLLEKGADPNVVSDYGESALSVASNYGRFDVVKILLAAGADPAPLQWTPFMGVVVFGDSEAIETFLDQGVDLSDRDRWSRTPFLLSLLVGDLEKVKLLLAAGAKLGEPGQFGQSALIYPLKYDHVDVLDWLLEEGLDPEMTDDFGETVLMHAVETGAVNCIRRLLEAGASADQVDDNGEKALSRARDLETLQLLLAAGADLNDINEETRRVLLGLEQPGQSTLSTLSREAYLAGKTRQFGRTNPERMDVPFWQAMVRSDASAWYARNIFDDTGDNMNDEPVWSASRFGRTLTALPDGRFVEIGGEHEDHYDPDFCIYNEVIVYQGDGRFEIYGYPKIIFPPTDFHSATLVGHDIYIIGSLGYREERRYGETPVYRLDTTTWAIEKLETNGDKPGWISRHQAIYREDKGIIHISGGKLCVEIAGEEDYVDNLEDYTLDLETMLWHRD